MKTKKKPCIGCNEQRSIESMRTAIKDSRDPRVADVVQRYGAIGVLKLMSHYFSQRHRRTGQDVFRDQAILCRNFAEVVQGRLKKTLSDEAFSMLMSSHVQDMKEVGLCVENCDDA